MRTLAWVSSLVLLLAPGIGFAAFASPSSLFESLRLQDISTLPTSVRLEAHGAADDTYVSFWMKGKSQAENPLAAKGTFQGTLDIMHKGKTVRLRGEMIVDMPNVYFRLQSVRGATDLEFSMAEVRPYLSKWIHADLTLLLEDADMGQLLSLQTSTDAQWEALSVMLAQEGIDLSAEQIKDSYMQIIDSLFAMTSKTVGAATTYTVTLKPDFINQALATVQHLGTSLFPDSLMPIDESDLAEMRKAQKILNESLTFSMTVTLGVDDEWQGHTAAVDFVPNDELLAEMDEDLAYARLRLEGARIDTFSVTAPKVWKTLEELLGGNLYPESVHVEDESDWEGEYWEPEGTTDLLPLTGPRSRRLTEEAARARRLQEVRSRQQ